MYHQPPDYQSWCFRYYYPTSSTRNGEALPEYGMLQRVEYRMYQNISRTPEYRTITGTPVIEPCCTSIFENSLLWGGAQSGKRHPPSPSERLKKKRKKDTRPYQSGQLQRHTIRCNYSSFCGMGGFLLCV